MAVILAAVHLHPLATIAPAVMIAALIAWHWARTGRADVPSSRRRLRRVSMALMLIALPLFVAGFSFIDGDVDHQRYLINWTIAVALLGLIVFTAVLDVLNNLRLHARQQEIEAVEAAGDLIEAMRRRSAAGSGGPSGGGSGSGSASS
jgi:hypothetical protein